MSKSRSLSKRKSGASESGTIQAQKAPTGILPPSLVRAEANSDAVELLTAAFVMCYPDVKDISELDKGERATWLQIREGLLQGSKDAREALKTIVGLLDKQVEAEIEDIQQRRSEALKDKAAKRKRKNQTHAQQLKIRLERHEQKQKELKDRHENQVLKERMLIAMTGISFISLIVCLVVASLTGHVVAYGGSALFSVLSAGGALRLFVFGRDEDEVTDGDDPPQG
jgi:hypothetical protein